MKMDIVQGEPGCNDTVERKTEWEGKVGLIYPSDFGYASSDYCEDLSDYYGVCRYNNWLYIDEKYFTITPNSSNASEVDLISSFATANNAYNYGEILVRPATYLKSSVQIIDGDGTDDYPFILK